MILKNALGRLQVGLLGTRNICPCVQVKIPSGHMDELHGTTNTWKTIMIRVARNSWVNRVILTVMTLWISSLGKMPRHDSWRQDYFSFSLRTPSTQMERQ